jgi:hypothetical protein
LQAADFLAVGTHVQKVCKALGVKLFAADPNQDSRGAQELPERVRLNTPAVALYAGAFYELTNLFVSSSCGVGWSLHILHWWLLINAEIVFA